MILNINKYTIRKNAPMIFTGLSIIGVVATGVLSARAALKAKEELDTSYPDDSKALIIAKHSILPVLAAGGTVASFCLARSADKKLIAAYAGTTAMLSKEINDMKAAMNDICTEEEKKEIEKRTRMESIPKNTCIIDEDGEIFYEQWSAQYLMIKKERLLESFHKLNRNFSLRGGVASLYEFLRLMGVPKRYIKEHSLDWTEYIGWHANWNMLYQSEPSFLIDYYFDSIKDGITYIQYDMPLMPICEDPPIYIREMCSLSDLDISELSELGWTKDDIEVIKEEIQDDEVE